MSLSEDLFSTWRPVCCAKWTESPRLLPPKPARCSGDIEGARQYRDLDCGGVRSGAKDGRRYGEICWRRSASRRARSSQLQLAIAAALAMKRRGRSDRWSSWHTESRGHADQRGQRIRLHLAHDLASMRLHGDLADAEFSRNLLIQQSQDHEGHDLTFARGQGGVRGAQHPHLRGMTEGDPTPLDGVRDRLQHGLVFQRLREKFDRTGLHGLHCHGYVAVTRDEDNRHVGAVRELLLQVEAVQSWEGHIEDQATWNRRGRVGQKLVRRRERHRSPASALDQQLKGVAYRDVIVDDKHD